ncbi:MAG: hypothetical protein HY927_07020 [Elusimicrobia bacterium]|nr:hypothetical protein [Elusimicrobiota bacterium]
MTMRLARFAAAVSFGLLSAAAPCRAEGPVRPGDPLFDGSAGASIDAAMFQALREAPRPAAHRAPARPKASADLYYFTPEEAAEAAKLPSFQPKSRGYTFDSDVPPAIQAQVRDDLAFIKGIQGTKATPLHQKIYGKVDGAAYTQFFESRVTGIGMSGCGNGNAVACVMPLMGPSKMWLTQNYIKFSHPQISRMMVVFHEARHTEARHLFWGHATCPDPFKDADGNDMKSIWTGALLAGEPACDKTPLGSYGSSTIMLKNIQKSCANCTEKVRMDAGLYGNDQLDRITDADARREMEADFGR